MSILGRLLGASQEPKLFARGYVFTREGEIGDCAWVIRSGSVSITVGETVIAIVGPGAVIGEMALIDGGVRSATVRAVTDVTAQEMTRRVFRHLIRACQPLAAYMLESLSDTLRRAQGLRQVALRVGGSEIRSTDASGAPLAVVEFPAGVTIFDEGELGDCAYLIQSGLVTLRKDVREIAQHGPGRLIGERAVFGHSHRETSALTVTPTICEVITRQQFEEALATMPEIMRELTFTYTSRLEKLIEYPD